MPWSVPQVSLDPLSPDHVKAKDLVKGVTIAATGSAFEQNLFVVFIKSGTVISQQAFDAALRSKSVQFKDDTDFSFTLQEASEPATGSYDAIVVQSSNGAVEFSVKSSALTID